MCAGWSGCGWRRMCSPRAPCLAARPPVRAALRGARGPVPEPEPRAGSEGSRHFPGGRSRPPPTPPPGTTPRQAPGPRGGWPRGHGMTRPSPSRAAALSWGQGAPGAAPPSERSWGEAGGRPPRRTCAFKVSGGIKVFLEHLRFHSDSEHRRRPHESPGGSQGASGWVQPPLTVTLGSSSALVCLSTWSGLGKTSGCGGWRTQRSLWGPIWGAPAPTTSAPPGWGPCGCERQADLWAGEPGPAGSPEGVLSSAPPCQSWPHAGAVPSSGSGPAPHLLDSWKSDASTLTPGSRAASRLPWSALGQAAARALTGACALGAGGQRSYRPSCPVSRLSSRLTPELPGGQAAPPHSLRQVQFRSAEQSGFGCAEAASSVS